MLRDRLIPDIWCCDSHRHISYLILTCIHLIFVMLNSWYLTPVLAVQYLTLDVWHRYLPCYIWHLISDTGACHFILDPWYPTPVLDMLSPGISTLDLILWPLTGYCYTWHRYYIAYSWLLLLWRLGMIIILLPDFWYSWTPVLLNFCTPVFLNPCNRETPDIILLLIPVIG